MQIRLYLDEDSMPKALAHNLRLRGIDITTVAEEGVYLIWSSWNSRPHKGV